MTLDWNWFFSSLSQSAAAIVGIFGAFIITKIFSNQSAFLEKTNKFKLLITQARKISDTANSFNIEWYNKHWNEGEFARFYSYFDTDFPDKEYEDDATDEGIKKYVEQSSFSIFSETSTITDELKSIVRDLCKENKERREAEEHRAPAPTGDLGSIAKFINSMQPLAATYLKPKPMRYGALVSAPWEQLHKERGELRKSYLEAKHHARVVSDFLDSIKGNPESPPQITYSLILVLFLFFVGVIYPLSFMPASGSPSLGFGFDLAIEYIFSLRGFFLGTISLAFTVIVLLFFNTNIKMKYPKEAVRNIELLASPENYCKNFKFLASTD